jgi:hypothetical protein
VPGILPHLGYTVDQVRYANIKEGAMAEYTYDGTYLREPSGRKMGEIDRYYVRSWNAALLGQIDRKSIRDANGKKLLDFDGKSLKDDLGKKVAGMKDIQNVIEGEPDIGMAALWYFLIKQKQANMT